MIAALAPVIQRMQDAAPDKHTIGVSTLDFEICALQKQWKHTSLEKYIQDFQQSFLSNLLASNRDELAKKARKTAAQPTARW